MFYRILIFDTFNIYSSGDDYIPTNDRIVADVTTEFASSQDALKHAKALQCLMGLTSFNSRIYVEQTVAFDLAE